MQSRVLHDWEREYAAIRITTYLFKNRVTLREFSCQIGRTHGALSGFMNGHLSCLGVPALKECAKQLNISFATLISPLTESERHEGW